MSRAWKIAVAVVVVFLIFAVISIPALVRSVLGLRRASATAEQQRRSIIQSPISTPTDTRVTAQLFWASPTVAGTLEPSQVELPLSADPVQRSKQLIAALITQAPTPAQSTLPADATLLQFYLLPDGTAIADFSDALGTETPSGILSEQMAVDSIVRTLGAGVIQVHQLKLLIHGQETETLAGHLDLTGFFPVTAPDSTGAPAVAPSSTGAASPAAPNPAPASTPAAPTGAKTASH
jgi:sporulation and spore germination protein